MLFVLRLVKLRFLFLSVIALVFKWMLREAKLHHQKSVKTLNSAGYGSVCHAARLELRLPNSACSLPSF